MSKNVTFFDEKRFFHLRTNRSSSCPRIKSADIIKLESHHVSDTNHLEPINKQWMVTAAKCDIVEMRKMLSGNPKLANTKDITNGKLLKMKSLVLLLLNC